MSRRGYSFYMVMRSQQIYCICSFSSLDTTWIRAGPVGLPEVEVSPVYFFKGLTLGQCCLPEGGQCHQCGIKEEGTEGVRTRTIGRQRWAWYAVHGAHLEIAFLWVNSVAFGFETDLYMTLFNICAQNIIGINYIITWNFKNNTFSSLWYFINKETVFLTRAREAC